MHRNIKQTFTSTGDPSSNGVAERWIDLVKVKAMVLLASRYLPTTFWCYAVPWVAYTYNQKTLGQTPKKSIPEFGQLILVRAKRDNKFQERAELGIMMGFYPQIPHGVIAVTIQRNKTISEIYTAHVAPAHMEKTERWFLKRDVKNPDRLVYVSTKGEVSWDVPVDTLPTVEEKQHWDRHPRFVSLQRARDGWAWYTSNIGRLLPNYRDIEVEGEEERLPYLGNSDFHAWQQIPETDAPLPDEENEPPPESDSIRDLFEDFNREPVEEDSGRLEEHEELGQRGSTSSRPPRQLRSRNVARSIKESKIVKFHDIVECIELDQPYQERLQLESKYTIFPSSQCQEDIDAMPREKWELLYDPTPSRALKRTRQQASVVAQQMLAKSHVSAVCLLDQKAETIGYTVLSDAVTKRMDREERKYQKAMMICVQGIGASLNNSIEALDVVDGLGQSHHESLRSTKWELWGKESISTPIPNIQPCASVIQQTLAHQNVPEYFQKDDAMKYSAEILDEEEVLQTTTCTPKDIYTDIKGWTTAFEVELFSFQTLDVKIDVREDTLDLRRVTILPGKAVMVKKPNGDGTHKKKARVVVCGNFQQVQPGEETCANTPSFPMLRVLVSLASLHGWSVASWDVSTAFLYASLPEEQEVYCRPPNVLVRLGLVQPGIVWKLKKALYGLRTSPKAWEEERDQKLGQLKWDGPNGNVGLVKVESANCVWMIQALDDKACSNPLGMVIAYVDDIIAVGEQDQLDGMKAELDKLYVMKTSGFTPSTYDPEVEPLRFLGCLIERMPSGQIIMHQRSYIDHCLKANDMEKLKGLTTLPAVDERSPPEEEVDENGQATDYEEHKSACQKQIGQFMWLATRTRPDISATLGILASQMVIRPKYVHGCLKQLWRYIVGTRELDMTSFEPNDVAFGELLLTLYVDASFSTGGGRSRTGIAMYLVNPIDGSESLVQWASRRQTSMATSAPEAEVSAMAEGFAASIFLFDSLKELKLVRGIGPSCILSMKTDSAVALKQLNTQSVTVRSRTAAQKLTYLRELVYQAPQVEPIYISGHSQRADGQTKILSGQHLREAQRHFNLIPPAELRIQVCYHPFFSPKLVSIQEDREFNYTPNNAGGETRYEKGTGGGGSKQAGSGCPQMTPQERKQYEWYMKKYHTADTARDPDKERERISMIIAALFSHCSHMPPERTERKQGRKKGLQGETPGESRDEIKARTAAQKIEQQQQRAKAKQRALEHAAPSNVHHMSTRQKAQTKPGSSTKQRSPSPSQSSSSASSSSSSTSSSHGKQKDDIQEEKEARAHRNSVMFLNLLSQNNNQL